MIVTLDTHVSAPVTDALIRAMVASRLDEIQSRIARVTCGAVVITASEVRVEDLP